MKYFVTLYFIFILLVLLNFSLGSLGKLIAFVVPDTRNISKEYCIQNNITPENTSFEGYSPLLPMGPKNLSPFKKIDNKYYPIDKNTKNILLSSNMYSRYKSKPQKYIYQNKLYDSISKQYILTKEYKPAKLQVTPIDIISIVNNAKYIYEVKNSNYSGPELQFYKIQ